MNSHYVAFSGLEPFTPMARARLLPRRFSLSSNAFSSFFTFGSATAAT